MRCVALVLAVSGVVLALTGWAKPASRVKPASRRCGDFALSQWRPQSRGFTPLSDLAAARCVIPAREIHPANAPFNRYVPSGAELRAWLATPGQGHQTPVQFNPYYKYVTGDYRGTTDEIIQWAAAKWGIPVNWLRAQYAQESIWYQQALGDLTYVGPAWYELYPPQARLPGTYEVYESMGLSQIKWIPDGSAGAGTEPLRWKSTAFSADYEAATVRFSYDDPGHARSRWGDPSYRPREAWNSIAAWFDPYPWGNPAQLWYVGRIQRQLRNHPWNKPYFNN